MVSRLEKEVLDCRRFSAVFWDITGSSLRRIRCSWDIFG